VTAKKDLSRAIQLNNKQPLYFYEKMKSHIGLNERAEATNMYQIVQGAGMKIEPEVQQLFNSMQ